MARRLTRTALPPPTRDRGSEHRAERVAQGERPPAGGRVPETRAPAASALGPGQPLPAAELGYFQRRLGTDLSAVRVHPEAGVASDLNANAFAIGQDIGLAPGRFRPGTPAGRRLLGHELAHVLEQGASRQPALQLDGPGAATDPELKLPAKDAAAKTDAVVDGLGTVADQAMNNERVKAEVIEPLKTWGLATWSALPGDEKAALVAGGVITAGSVLGPLLTHPNRARIFSDFNLAMPLGLVPYSTLTDFRYKLPGGANGPITFAATFSGDDWLGLMLGSAQGQFSPTLALDFTWSYDPGSDSLSTTGAKLNMGVLPGLKVQAGAGVGLSWPTPMTDPNGGPAWSMQSLPESQSGLGAPGYGAFISVDLAQLPVVPPWLRFQLGGKPEK